MVTIKFLEKLVNAPSPTGFEQPAQSVIREYLSDIADSISTDVLGNVDCILNKSGDPRIVLMAHVDEVGFQIRYITEKGCPCRHICGKGERTGLQQRGEAEPIPKRPLAPTTFAISILKQSF